jgi:cytidyltransferase-like protein
MQKNLIDILDLDNEENIIENNFKKNALWQKNVHVKSSLERKDGQFSFFIGRWQPLHDGHKKLFKRVLDEGGNVLIGIRDVQPDEKNPFTASEVFVTITDYYVDLIKGGRVKVMKIPDICSIEFGRGVGYDIIEHIPPQEIAEISATKVREEMRKNGQL